MQLFPLSLHSLAAGPGSSSSHLVACITTLYLFCKIRPSLLLRHATTLHPYLSSTCTVWSKHIVFLSKIQLVFSVELKGDQWSRLYWPYKIGYDWRSLLSLLGLKFRDGWTVYSVTKSTFQLWNILLCGYNRKPGFWILRQMNSFTSMLSPWTSISETPSLPHQTEV